MNPQTHTPPRVNGSNGAAHAGEQPVSINPVEIAQLGLMFLARCDLKPAERQPFAHVEMLLQAIASGQVMLAAAPSAQAELPLDAPPPPVAPGH